MFSPQTVGPIVLKGLFDIGVRAEEIPWEPYKKGVEIYRLYGDGIIGSTAVLLRYDAKSEVPLHEHPGFEHILVLTGSQQDHRGKYETGTLVINQPGTQHRVVSSEGCIVLAIYEKPVQFVKET
jgi:anti-sigma factor ChrR (cupin superfamily)